MLWESLRMWLFQHGYILYHPGAFGRLPCPHPWAIPPERWRPTCYEHVSSSLSFAEHMTSSHAALDFNNRDVIIILTPGRTALTRSVQPLEKQVPGSLIQVLKLGSFLFLVFLQEEAQWFGIWPRIRIPGHIFYVLCSTFESLNFMHQNGISFSDLYIDATATLFSRKFDVTNVQRQGAKVVPSVCGLPMMHGFGHSMNRTGSRLDKTSQFIDDVLWFGQIMAFMFKSVTPHVPLLAPLLECLTSKDDSCRLTSAQALDLIKKTVLELHADQNYVTLERFSFDPYWSKSLFDISAEDAYSFAEMRDGPPVDFEVLHCMFQGIQLPLFLYNPTRHILPVPELIEDWYYEFNSEQIWQGLHDWFLQNSYELYTNTPRDPQLLFPVNTPRAKSTLYDGDPYPFAFYQQDYSNGYAVRSHGSLVYPAIQNSCNDVMIKVVATDSEELRILRRLNSEPCLSHPLNFTIPVLDFLKYDEKMIFVIMPKWGHNPLDGWFETMKNVFDYILSMLKSIAFLHEFDIVHRDIDTRNTVVNLCPRPDQNDYSTFRRTGLARYALIDFDISISFESDTPKHKRRRPVQECRMGHSRYHPLDVTDEQYEDESNTYDPFSYDVASLGGLFCEQNQHLTPMCPPLAPFLDRMVTPDINARFTAMEALHGFEEIMQSQGEDLRKPSLPPPPTIDWREWDRWKDLPPSFVTTYRTDCL